MRTLMLLLLASIACAQNGASLTVGDEVVFSGGPSQPPQSKQTGLVFEVNNIRGGGGEPGTAGKKGKKSGAQASVGSASTLADQPPAPPPLPDLSPLSTDELTVALGDAQAARREAAVNALAGHTRPDERSIVRPSLETALTDSEPAVVRAAAVALGRLGDASAAPAVMKLVYDRDDGVAVSAIRTVATLGYKTALPELTKLGGRDQGPVGAAAREAAAELARPPRSVPIDPKTQPVPTVK